MKTACLNFAFLIFLVATACSPTGLSADERPNIILMMADDLGWGDPSYNQGWIETPALDAMASAGLRFNRFYSASPVCSPTRASCLTGRHPYRLGIQNANRGRLESRESVISEVLQTAGYTTGHFGKWHLGTLTTLRKDSNRGKVGNDKVFSPPWQHGFEVCFSTEAKVPTFHPMRRTVNNLAEPTSFSDPNFYGTHYWHPPKNRRQWDTAAEGTVVEITDNLSGDDSKIVMDRVLPFIERSVKNQQPFFAVIWFHTPHKPLVDANEQSKVDSAKAYASAIQAMDGQIHRLRSQLKTLNVSNQTMLWFCSDNGPEKGVGKAGPLRARKRSLYEGGIRVPGVLVWPSVIPAGRETDFAACTSDYYPTIVDYLNLTPANQKPLDGISLRPVIEENSAARKKPIGFQSGKQTAWMNQRYKIISQNAGKDYQLFDLQEDPSETHDLSQTKVALKAKLLGELETWLHSVEADRATGNPSR
ncbi:MAG: sulfatase-like hydrolase/transferase [Pirellulaceae bacterium]|nr:sulfatase-like hydrolase/transferase [Pirellulaceae bacterium]